MCEGGQCPAVDAGKVDGAAGSGGTAGDSGSGGAAGAGQDASSSASPFCQDWCSKVVGANCPKTGSYDLCLGQCESIILATCPDEAKAFFGCTVTKTELVCDSSGQAVPKDPTVCTQQSDEYQACVLGMQDAG